jgi:hypothetical protein
MMSQIHPALLVFMFGIGVTEIILVAAVLGVLFVIIYSRGR